MRPLAEADLRGVRGLAFDVDDTLTTHGILTPPAFAALTRLKDAGFGLMALTGRPLGWTDAMASTWPVDIAIGENGAGWSARTDRALHVGYFDDEATRRGQRELLEVVGRAVATELPGVRLSSDQPARRCDLAFDVGESVRLSPGALDRLEALIEEHGCRVATSSVHAHVIAGGWDKAKGAQAAVEDVLGVALAPSEWVFVGDSGNDAAAFAYFERSVGVANVAEHLQRLETKPRWVTEGARGAGFAELAEALLESLAR